MNWLKKIERHLKNEKWRQNIKEFQKLKKKSKNKFSNKNSNKKEMDFQDLN